MAHDIANQIQKYIDKSNDSTFLKKLYCNPILKIITIYKKKIYKTILKGYHELMFDYTTIYTWDRIENPKVWVDLTTGKPLDSYIHNNNSTVTEVYFYSENEKMAWLQLIQELDLKIIKKQDHVNSWFVMSWAHWKTTAKLENYPEIASLI